MGRKERHFWPGRFTNDNGCAVLYGNANVVEYLYQRIGPGFMGEEETGRTWVWDVGHTSILDWMQEKGLLQVRGFAWTESVTRGNFHDLEWLDANGYSFREFAAESEFSFVLSAVLRGDLRIMRWAVDNGISFTEYSFSVAANEERIYVLQFLVDNDCPLRRTDILNAEDEVGNLQDHCV